MAAEKNFENKIKKYLKSINAWHIKYWGGAKYTKSGIPDIITCINGYFFAIEVKAPTGHPSHLQLYEIRKIRQSNGIGIILYPEDYKKFISICDALQNGMRSVAEDYQFETDDHLTDEERWILYGKSL